MVEECIYEKELLNEKFWFLILSSISLFAPIVLMCFKPEFELYKDWFSRSGYIMVVSALFAEMRAFQMSNILNPSFLPEVSFETTKNKYLRQVKLYNKVAFILIAIGTLIWGYGDLIYEWVNET